MEGHRSTGQSPQWAVVPMEEEEEEEEGEKIFNTISLIQPVFNVSAKGQFRCCHWYYSKLHYVT